MTQTDKDIVKKIVSEMEHDLGTDREAAIADMRYAFIEKLVSKTVVRSRGESREQERSIKIDRVLTHAYFGIPCSFS